MTENSAIKDRSSKVNSGADREADSEANSQVLAVLLTVAIVIILAMVVLLWAMSLEMPDVQFPSKTPAIFEIRQLKSTAPNYEGKITLYNGGKIDYLNSDLYAEIYRNDVLLPCRIETFRGTDFIPTHHYHVKTISGSGCRNDYWRKGEKVAIDITDGLIRPGDRIRVDVFSKTDNSRISTDTNIVPQ